MRVLFVGPAHTPFVRDCMAPFLGQLDAALVSTTPAPAPFLAAHPRLRFELLPRPALRALPRVLFAHTLDYVAELWDLLLRRFRPDVLHLYYVSQLDALALLPLTLLPASRGVPVVLTVMGADVLEDQVARPWPLERMVRRLFRRAAAVTAKTHFLADRCVALGARREAIHVVPWGLPRGVFVPGERAAARRALGLPDGERLLLSTRTLAPLYNHDALVEALAAAAPSPPARLVFSRAAEDTSYARRVEERARALGLPATFLPGLPVDRMPLLYAAGDAVASLPSSDGLPQTLLEALACERPTLGLDLPAYRELPFAGDAFARVTQRGGRPDAQDLARGLRELLADRPRPGLAQARAWIEANMRMEDSVAAVWSIYRALAGR